MRVLEPDPELAVRLSARVEEERAAKRGDVGETGRESCWLRLKGDGEGLRVAFLGLPPLSERREGLLDGKARRRSEEWKRTEGPVLKSSDGEEDTLWRNSEAGVGDQVLEGVRASRGDCAGVMGNLKASKFVWEGYGGSGEITMDSEAETEKGTLGEDGGPQ